MCYQAYKDKGAVDVVNHKLAASNHVFYYESNVQLVKGEDQIAWHKLSDAKVPQRFYCKCCGTPFGFKWTGMTAFYGPLIQPREASNDDKSKNDRAFPEPMYAFHADCAPQECLENHSDSIKKYYMDKDIPFAPIARFMSRNLLGAVTGKNKGSFKAPTDDAEYGIGREMKVQD